MQPAALLEAAAEGRLPAWSHVGDDRFAHMQRVSVLLGAWAVALELPAAERIRWQAAGYLHDALREAPPEELRGLVPESLKNLTGKLLHGPAAAARLRADGVEDEGLLRALAYHTIGHPEFDELGRSLFIADYIEPGRRYDPAGLATLRARMPSARNEVLRDVLRARLDRMLREGRPIRAETVAFWNVVNGVPARVPA